MKKLTRKELKTDHFVEEVEHGVEYVAGHKKQFVYYGVAAAVLLIVGLGVYLFMQSKKAARQEALNKAYSIQMAPFGPPNPQQGFTPPYPTQAARDVAATKAFAEVSAAYPTSEEGLTAKYFMGTQAANEAKWSEAEKLLNEVAGNANAETASLAQFSLAQVYAAQNKTADAEKILRALADKPTTLVSKEQAQITLGRLLMKSKPAEGRKLLESLRTASSAASRSAVGALGEAN